MTDPRRVPMKEFEQVTMFNADIGIPEDFIVVTAYSEEENKFYWESYYVEESGFQHKGEKIDVKISEWMPHPKREE